MERKILDPYLEYADHLVVKMIGVIPDHLIKHSSLIHCRAKQLIVRSAEPVTYAYFMLKGTVSVSMSTEEGQIATYLTMEPPTVISDLEVLCENRQYLADVVAVTECDLLKCPIVLFIEELHQNAEFLWQVASVTARNNHALVAGNKRIVYRSGMERVVYYILNYFKKNPPKGTQRLSIPKTQSEIASELMLSTKTISRSLQKLKQGNYITIEKKHILIGESQYQVLCELAQKSGEQ